MGLDLSEASTTVPILGKITGKQLAMFSGFMGKAVVVFLITLATAFFVKVMFFRKKHKTAKEIVDLAGGDGCLKGKTILVTGGNSGIGLEACKAFLFAGARVIMCSRSVAAAQKAVDEEIKQPGEGKYVAKTDNLVIKELDLNSLKSIHKFAQDILATEKKLDILVLNAGIMALPKREETADGFEKQIGVNHFGHVYLEQLLEGKLVAGKTEADPGRVVVLSSVAHNMGSVEDCKDLHYNKGRKYGQWKAYGQSKQANLLYAKWLDEKFLAKKIPLVAISLHPGAIQTNLWKSTGVASGIGAAIASYVVMDKNIPEGASTTVWAAVSREILKKEIRGGYLVDCAPAEPTTKDAKDKDGKFRNALMEATQSQLDNAVKSLGL
jgi:NAD(P)-dependent dehydrogenase (short-subunit alcohol dehydrogenase family)